MKKYNLKVKKNNNFLIDFQELKELQKLSLEDKIRKAEVAIQEFYNYNKGNVCVSFSGGKDSTVLLDLVRSLYDDVSAVFCNTGLEYPEIVNFVKQVENVIWLKPKHSFNYVIKKYGYPVISKRVSQQIHQLRYSTSRKLVNIMLDKNSNYGIAKKWLFLENAPFEISHLCCYHLKKVPLLKFQKEKHLAPFIGMMSEDSKLRELNYMKTGCNNFHTNKSNPLGIWTEKDIWEYIHKYNIKYSKIYDMGYDRTGCIFCCFGIHLQKSPNRFELMKQTHPKLYNYCMNQLNLDFILNYLKIKH